MAESGNEHSIDWVREAALWLCTWVCRCWRCWSRYPPGSTAEAEHYGWTILLTAIGLLLANYVAFRARGRVRGGDAAMAVRHNWATGIGVTAGRFRYGHGYRSVRSDPASRARALLYTAVWWM